MHLDMLQLSFPFQTRFPLQSVTMQCSKRRSSIIFIKKTVHPFKIFQFFDILTLILQEIVTDSI